MNTPQSVNIPCEWFTTSTGWGRVVAAISPLVISSQQMINQLHQEIMPAIGCVLYKSGPDISQLKLRGKFFVLTADYLSDSLSYFFSDDGFNPISENVCVCSIASLMTAGCKCGQMTRERG